MKLSQVLQRQHLGWAFKQKWKVLGKKRVVDSGVVENLRASGINVVDALQYTRSKERQIVQIPEPWNFSNDRSKSEHPDWHERDCHFFYSNTALLEGQAHAQVLTKTVCKLGFPQALEENFSRCTLSEELVRNVKYAVEYSRIWDAYQVKLPKIIDKERLWYTYKRVYGIPHDRIIRLLINSLLRQCDLYCSDMDGDKHLKRSIFHDVTTSVPLEKDGDLLQYRITNPTVVTAERELSPFAEEAEVAETKSTDLPSIYPIRHTLDLVKENIYTLDNYFSIPRHVRHPHAHTLFIHHTGSEDDWSTSQTFGHAIATCYAVVNARARLKFGVDVKELPHPISVQCIHTDGKRFDFILYQLNTLDADGDTGVKNLAWIDAGHNLFDQCDRNGKEIIMEGFNPDTFRRMLSLYLNGLNNDGSSST